MADLEYREPVEYSTPPPSPQAPAREWLSHRARLILTLVALCVLAVTQRHWKPYVPDFWIGAVYGGYLGHAVTRAADRRKPKS